MLILSNRVPESQSFSTPSSPFAQVVDRRLAIAQKGLDEARQHLAAGQTEDVDTILDKLDEDLFLLRRRLRREAEQSARRPTVLYDCAGASSESN
jgi:regulator of protease activity HflC (stomatin/prohibitin superfamily)